MVKQNNKRLPDHSFFCRPWICLCWWIFHHKPLFVKVPYILCNHQSVGIQLCIWSCILCIIMHAYHHYAYHHYAYHHYAYHHYASSCMHIIIMHIICILIIKVLCIQFHWQFLIISSGFRLVNTLLRKFDASSEKEKTQIFWWKTTKKCQI